VCSWCGFTPTTDPQHCKEPEGKLRKPPRQKEQVVELPPAYDAAPLFKDAHKALMREIEELRDRREVMQGELFTGIANKEYRGWWSYRREDFPDTGEWEEFCRECGEDPASEEISVPAGRIPTSLGALQAPTEPLTTLIAAYRLIKGSKRTRAVEVDYRKPDSARTTFSAPSHGAKATMYNQTKDKRSGEDAVTGLTPTPPSGLPRPAGRGIAI